MPSPTVWFNKYLGNTWELLRSLREERRPDEFRVLCTHPRPTYRGSHYADEFEPEPDGLPADDYVAHCLEVAARHRITLFFPGRNLIPVLAARDRFAALGTRVLATGDADTVRLINHKARLAEAVAGVAGVRLPEYQVVNDLTGFDDAYARLRSRHAVVCYKPAVSVYGIGFQVVSERPGFSHPNGITLDAARDALGRDGRFTDLLVMRYLPGPERSVDCLAEAGRLAGCIVRRKEDGAQLIEHNPRLQEVAGRLAAQLGLTGLFNVQFRDAGGEPHLLEINPRMAGGLPLACRSGLNPLLWAIRLALGTATPADVPAPRTGFRVPQPVPAQST